MEPKRIVITGGPGTGKTSVIKCLEDSGYFCFHEIIRSMTLEAKKGVGQQECITNPLAFVADPMAFNARLLKGRIQQFTQAGSIGEPLVFFDRGIPDVLAYMRYFGQVYGASFEDACKEHTYDHIILLPPWEAIYVSDNERLESFEEAIAIHYRLQETYEQFGYTPLLIPEGSITTRTSWILEKLNLPA